MTNIAAPQAYYLRRFFYYHIHEILVDIAFQGSIIGRRPKKTTDNFRCPWLCKIPM